jgi:hypothetical protein
MAIPNSNANALTISKPHLLALTTNAGNASVSSWGVQDAGYNPNEDLMEVLTTKMQAEGQGGVNENTTDPAQPMVRIPFPWLISLFGAGGMILIAVSRRSSSPHRCRSLAGSSLCKGNGAFSIHGVQLSVVSSLLLIGVA